MQAAMLWLLASLSGGRVGVNSAGCHALVVGISTRREGGSQQCRLPCSGCRHLYQEGGWESTVQAAMLWLLASLPGGREGERIHRR